MPKNLEDEVQKKVKTLKKQVIEEFITQTVNEREQKTLRMKYLNKIKVKQIKQRIIEKTQLIKRQVIQISRQLVYVTQTLKPIL